MVNYEGKVTSATAMTFVHRDKKSPTAVPFDVYAPYFTHSVSAEGRHCKDCHGTEEAKKLAAGQKVQMTSFKDGKLQSIKATVPVVPELLSWEYLDKKDGKWEVLSVEGKVQHQMVGYGTPFTEKQLKRLAKPRKQKK